MPVVSVLLVIVGAGITLAASLSLGRLLVAWLGIPLTSAEVMFLGLASGSALLSLCVFAITSVGLAFTPVFVAIACLCIAAHLCLKSRIEAPERKATISRPWKLLFIVLYIPYALLYVVNALAPEVSPDGVAYHVALPARYLRKHRFPHIATDMYAALSQGLEMLFMVAYSVGRHSAASAVHVAFLLVLPLGLMAWARRFSEPVVGVVAGALVFMSPIVGRTGSVAYVDVALATVIFALFYILELWKETGGDRLLIAAGLLAGFAYSIKYTAAVAIIYAVGVVVLRASKQDEKLIRLLLLLLSSALAMVAPWICKNFLFLGNPIAPFGNWLFPNPFFYASTEANYTRVARSFNGVGYGEIPLEATVYGERLLGFTGPIFLLAPLALLSARSSAGRRVIAAALVFGAVYFANIGTRFLIPALPFIAIGMAIVLSRRPVVGAVIVVIHAVLSWPNCVTMYSSPHAWTITGFPLRAALRIDPEEEYLRRHTDYDAGLLLERHVPAGNPVFSTSAPQKAYHSREIIVGYQSAKGIRLQETLWSPLYEHLRPTQQYCFRFASSLLRRIRIAQTGRQMSWDDQWKISEVVLLRQGQAIGDLTEASVRARPNPWDAVLLIDGNRATLWRSGDGLRPGMFVELSFRSPLPADEVRLECTPGQWSSRMELHYETEDGQQGSVSEPAIVDAGAATGLRQAARRFFLSEGVRWLLIGNGDRGSADFFENQKEWGFTMVESVGEYRLYRVN